ncbi:phytoene/squalene synthase family protein, partial [Stenotrophomonas sp. MB339]
RLLMGDGRSPAGQRAPRHLLWGRRASCPVPRPARVGASRARARVAAQAAGKPIGATPARTVLRVWWAARG